MPSDRAQQPSPAPGVTVGQWRLELGSLVEEYRRLDPRRVLEIGTWHGGTLYQLLTNASPGSHIISVDRGPAYWRPAQPGFDTSIWQTWAPEGVALHVLEADSHEPETVIKVMDIAPELDFLFIDGDHSYEGGKQDFEMYGPLVRPGGIIAFHDLITPYDKPHIQIGKLWKEIRQAGYKVRECYSHPRQEWGGIGLVYV